MAAGLLNRPLGYMQGCSKLEDVIIGKDLFYQVACDISVLIVLTMIQSKKFVATSIGLI